MVFLWTCDHEGLELVFEHDQIIDAVDWARKLIDQQVADPAEIRVEWVPPAGEARVLSLDDAREMSMKLGEGRILDDGFGDGFDDGFDDAPKSTPPRAQPAPTAAVVMLIAPDGSRWARLRGYEDVEKAEADADRYNAAMPKRAKVVVKK